MSSIRKAAAAGSELISKANVPRVVVVAAERSRQFATETLPQATKQATEWARNNPGKAALSVAAGVGAACVVAPGAVAAPVLGAAGFTSGGIAAGSIAASVQSGLGSVVAPSLFSTLQSAAAGGYGAATVGAAVQAAGGTVASAAGAALTWAKVKANM